MRSDQSHAVLPDNLENVLGLLVWQMIGVVTEANHHPVGCCSGWMRGDSLEMWNEPVWYCRLCIMEAGRVPGFNVGYEAVTEHGANAGGQCGGESGHYWGMSGQYIPLACRYLGVSMNQMSQNLRQE
jgi:hypothetical protein